jgi:predicted molibdopterin-dependent oxidoreductase YjgC
VRAIVMLGHDLPIAAAALSRARELAAMVVLTSHERGSAKVATVALPIAAWAETPGSVTNRDGRLQRMHTAFEPPGQAIAGWEAVVRLAQATGVKLNWQHAREVWKDMTAAVTPWKGQPWGREVRPTQLRFAGSRG